MRNFSQELKDIIKRADDSLSKNDEPKSEPESKPPKQKYERPLIAYNINVRDLPPTGLNKPVVFGLDEREADWLIATKLKPKLMEYDKENDIRKVVYYEKVRDDGWKAGIYDNLGKIVINEEDI